MERLGRKRLRWGCWKPTEIEAIARILANTILPQMDSGGRRPQYLESHSGEPPHHIGRHEDMKWLKRHWRGILRVLSLLLVCLGIFCGYWWFYKLAPARRTLDPEWHASHSQREYWREVQKGIHRGMWLHDDGFAVGMYGDKSWAEWIMAHVKPGASMGCLGGQPCSLGYRHAVHHEPGRWRRRRRMAEMVGTRIESKSQEEWIADGFRHRGFDVDVPPKTEQTPTLLALLGNSGYG